MWDKFKAFLRRIILENRDPESIALGVALGVFICVLPVYGLHTLLVVVFALVVPRANKIAMLLGTNVSLPPTVPFITWAGYEIGRMVFWEKGYLPLGAEYFKNFGWTRLADFYLPLFIGSLILGTVGAGVAYLLMLNVIQWRRKAMSGGEQGGDI